MQKQKLNAMETLDSLNEVLKILEQDAPPLSGTTQEQEKQVEQRFEELSAKDAEDKKKAEEKAKKDKEAQEGDATELLDGGSGSA